MKFVTSICNMALDLIFPRNCLGCGEERVYLCENCEKSLANTKPPAPLHTDYLDTVYIACEYAGDNIIGKLIKRVKYKFSLELASVLAETVVRNLSNELREFKGVMIPVPLSKGRMRWRGFNQSELIGKKVASDLASLSINIKFDTELLKKNRDTKQQAECKSKAERLENLHGAFQIDVNRKIPEHVILFDDVYTTGTTLNECARVLKNAGVKKVFGLAIAKKTSSVV